MHYISETIIKHIEFKEKQVLVLSEIGKLTIEYMNKNFNSILDYDYTARLESSIDKISIGQTTYLDVVDSLYQQLKKHLN